MTTSDTAYTLDCDGGCEPNPGGVGSIAFIFAFAGGGITKKDIICKHSEVLNNDKYKSTGSMTSNVAEYVAVIKGLQYVEMYFRDNGDNGDNTKTSLIVNSDSQVVVKQINGEYGVSSENLKIYHCCSKELIKYINEDLGVSVEMCWHPREEMQDVDDMINEVSEFAISNISENQFCAKYPVGSEKHRLAKQWWNIRKKYSDNHRRLYEHMLKFTNAESITCRVYSYDYCSKLNIQEDELNVMLVDFIKDGLVKTYKEIGGVKKAKLLMLKD